MIIIWKNFIKKCPNNFDLPKISKGRIYMLPVPSTTCNKCVKSNSWSSNAETSDQYFRRNTAAVDRRIRKYKKTGKLTK